ncbi:MAG: hypothetical protein QXI90_00515 [Thermofilum sp.]
MPRPRSCCSTLLSRHGRLCHLEPSAAKAWELRTRSVAERRVARKAETAGGAGELAVNGATSCTSVDRERAPEDVGKPARAQQD